MGEKYAALFAVDDARIRAMEAADVTALRQLLAPDCRYVHSMGAIDTRDAYLATVENGTVRYPWVKATERHVIELGEHFLLMHRMEAEVILKGNKIDYRSNAVAAWRKTASGFELAFFQATALPKT